MKIETMRYFKIVIGILLILSILPISMGITTGKELKVPAERTIVLRLDDVQGFAWDSISMNLTDTILNNNMNLTLGVIPVSNIDKDVTIKNYLINISKNPRVELAQHGYKHAPREYFHITQNAAYKITNLGYQSMAKILGVKPKTFIPPFNQYDSNAEKAIARLGFRIISASKDEYKTDNGLNIIGYNTETSLDQKNLVQVGQILQDCNNSLNKKNICVIMIHPEDYVSKNDKDMNPSKYKEFVSLLKGLKTLNARFETFSQIN